MKRIFLTGAFGNIGLNTLDELLVRGYNVTTFDLPNRKNFRQCRKFKKKWTNRITAKWGDLRNYKEVENAMEDIEAVIHLGAVIPPTSSKYPNLAYEVNVGGTSNVIKAMEIKSPHAHLIFTSSFTIYGNRNENPIISVGDSFDPIDSYAKHKLECERLIQSSNLKWTILRLTWVPSTNDLKLFRYMFDVPLETKIEICVAKDVGLSLVNTLNNIEASDRIFNIACGRSSRTQYGQYLMEMLEIFGLGKDAVPAEAFSHKGTFGGWIKPQGSQRVLKYHKTSLSSFYMDMKSKYRIIRYLIKFVRPFAKFIIIKQSPYIKNYKTHHTISKYLSLIQENRGKLSKIRPVSQETVT
jgi:nucleoside-diphosphate-sugar epimerase